MASTRSGRFGQTSQLALGREGMELWFKEQTGLGLESGLSLKIETVLTRFRSKFQEIAVLETAGYGRMLVLDGIIQLTELDEAGYHEMIAHVPLTCHPSPHRTLIIGGGDGGAVREVLKHPQVERVVLCELDPEVVRVSRKFLPGLSQGLTDARVDIVHQDGAGYAARHPDSFEVIIVDSPDPVGPAKVLFERPFYENLTRALTAGGIAGSQAENYLYHPQVIKTLFGFIPQLFEVSAYYQASVPTYPGGQIGFAFCSQGPHPWQDLNQVRAAALPDLSYYSPAVHRAAFALPPRALALLPEPTRLNQA